MGVALRRPLGRCTYTSPVVGSAGGQRCRGRAKARRQVGAAGEGRQCPDHCSVWDSNVSRWEYRTAATEARFAAGGGR